MKSHPYIFLLLHLSVSLSGTTAPFKEKKTTDWSKSGLNLFDLDFNTQNQSIQPNATGLAPSKAIKAFGVNYYERKMKEGYEQDIKDCERGIKETEQIITETEAKKQLIKDPQVIKKLELLILSLKRNLLAQKESKERLQRASNQIKSNMHLFSQPKPKYKKAPLICKKISNSIKQRLENWLIMLGVFEENRFYQFRLEKWEKKNQKFRDYLIGAKRENPYLNNPSFAKNGMIWNIQVINDKMVSSTTSWWAFSTEQMKQINGGAGKPFFLKEDYVCFNCNTKFSGYPDSESCFRCHSRSHRINQFRRKVVAPNQRRNFQRKKTVSLSKPISVNAVKHLKRTALKTGWYLILYITPGEDSCYLLSSKGGQLAKNFLNPSFLKTYIQKEILFKLCMGDKFCKCFAQGDPRKTMTYTKGALSFTWAITHGYVKEASQKFYIEEQTNKNLKHMDRKQMEGNNRSEPLLPPYNKLFVREDKLRRVQGFFRFVCLSIGFMEPRLKSGVTLKKIQLERFFMKQNMIS